MLVLIVFPFVLLLWLIFPIVGAGMARRRNRDPAIWAIVCLFLPLGGIIVLLIAGDAPDRSMGRFSGGSGDRNDEDNRWLRWQALIDVDPDISAAAERVRAFGARYERDLADKYIALNDKSHLSALVAKTLESAGHVEPPDLPKPARFHDPDPDPGPAPAPPPEIAPTPRALTPPALTPPAHNDGKQNHDRVVPRATQSPSARPGVDKPRPAMNARALVPAKTPGAAGAPATGKIRNSVYRKNPDGSFTIIKGRHAGRSFRNFEDMRRTLR